MPKAARMLVLFSPQMPPEGAHAIPMRGPKLLYWVGEIVLGTPGSPGTTLPVGESGNFTDCSPGTGVVSRPKRSLQGRATSQRKPRFTVRFGFAFQLSWTKSPRYRVRLSNNWIEHCTNWPGAPM